MLRFPCQQHHLHHGASFRRREVHYPFFGFDFKSRFMRNPFVKFISHSASYMFFLTLLALASQRFEYMLISIVLFFFPDIEVTLK